ARSSNWSPSCSGRSPPPGGLFLCAAGDGFARYNRRMHRDHDIAIVGGGAAGTLAAIHLLRRAAPGLRIAMYEPSLHPGEGVAYSTRRPEHLLNVPAGKMSALPDEPGDFLAWLAARREY